MKFMFRIGAAVLLLTASNAIAAVNGAAAVTRCGWIENPTPGNWWLTDRDGDWILATQGSDEETLGMDKIGDISAHDYRQTNGNYGYACGCMRITADASTKKITKVLSFRQLPLSKCLQDKNLPAPE